jgi:hypothetical protein
MVLSGLVNGVTIFRMYYYLNISSKPSHLLSLFLPLYHNYITISFFSLTHLLEKAKLDNYFENTLSKFPSYLFIFNAL